MKKIYLIIIMFCMPLFTTADEFSPEKAAKVDRFMKRIQRSPRRSVFMRKISFTEEELNAYLNLFYLKKYMPEIKYINLKLEKDNSVSGQMKVKLSGKKYSKIPSFLKDIDVDVSGRLECQNYRVRFIFKDLKVNGTGFSPEVLDEAFMATQSGYRVQKSMFDWFSLLPGIKDVLIDYRKITIFY